MVKDKAYLVRVSKEGKWHLVYGESPWNAAANYALALDGEGGYELAREGGSIVVHVRTAPHEPSRGEDRRVAVFVVESSMIPNYRPQFLRHEDE